VFRTLPLAHIPSSAELLCMSLKIVLLVWSDPERFLVNILHLQADGFAGFPFRSYFLKLT
jgi:hypothetical protein